MGKVIIILLSIFMLAGISFADQQLCYTIPTNWVQPLSDAINTRFNGIQLTPEQNAQWSDAQKAKYRLKVWLQRIAAQQKSDDDKQQILNSGGYAESNEADVGITTN